MHLLQEPDSSMVWPFVVHLHLLWIPLVTLKRHLAMQLDMARSEAKEVPSEPSGPQVPRSLMPACSKLACPIKYSGESTDSSQGDSQRLLAAMVKLLAWALSCWH